MQTTLAPELLYIQELIHVKSICIQQETVRLFHIRAFVFIAHAG
jgi:hypothetical protein